MFQILKKNTAKTQRRKAIFNYFATLRLCGEKKNCSICLLVLLLSFCYFDASAQGKKFLIRSGDNAMKIKNYSAAVKLYYSALQKDTSSLTFKFKYAEALRLNNNPQAAEKYYKQVLRRDTINFPTTYCNLASALKNEGKYDEAIKYYQLFMQKFKSRKISDTNLAQNQLDAIDYIKKNNVIDNKIKITKLHFDIENVFSEFGAFLQNDTTMTFTALSSTKDDTTQFVSKMYKTSKSGDEWLDVTQFDTTLNGSNFYNANYTFSKKQQAIYFSRCANGSNKIHIYRCKIYKGKLKKPELLRRPINIDTVNSTHPFILKATKGEIMIFASDRKGSLGGYDLWSVAMDSLGSFGTVRNLGANVNTTQDEITPFYDRTDSTLYYSSNNFTGFGGFDVFKAKGTLENLQKSQNMGQPINSAANDLYFFPDTKHKRGYFTSNRPGSYVFDRESCCNNIYTFKIPDPPPPDSLHKPALISQRPPAIDTFPEISSKQIVEKIKDFLPISIYFDNDSPNPQSNDTTTSENYTDLINDYLERETEFETKYQKMQKDKQKAKKEIADLFNNKIEKGSLDLTMVAENVNKLLIKGKKVQITLKGYSSPLHSDQYNFNLSKRRIQSVKNFFQTYDNGLFEKYLSSHQFTITEQAFGKKLASKNISSNRNDVAQSVFSPEASLERKVEITNLLIK